MESPEKTQIYQRAWGNGCAPSSNAENTLLRFSKHNVRTDGGCRSKNRLNWWWRDTLSLLSARFYFRINNFHACDRVLSRFRGKGGGKNDGGDQEGGAVSRVNIGSLITASVTSRHTSVIFKMAGKFLVRYVAKDVNFLNVWIHLLPSSIRQSFWKITWKYSP